jgi:hypothetical protein
MGMGKNQTVVLGRMNKNKLREKTKKKQSPRKKTAFHCCFSRYLQVDNKRGSRSGTDW